MTAALSLRRRSSYRDCGAHRRTVRAAERSDARMVLTKSWERQPQAHPKHRKQAGIGLHCDRDALGDDEWNDQCAVACGACHLPDSRAMQIQTTPRDFLQTGHTGDHVTRRTKQEHCVPVWLTETHHCISTSSRFPTVLGWGHYRLNSPSPEPAARPVQVVNTSGPGMAASKALVYACRGVKNTSCTLPASTT